MEEFLSRLFRKILLYCRKFYPTAKEDGENDGDEWIAVFRLKDGKFAYLEAGCDFTGWDCQAGGVSYTADSLEALCRNYIPEKGCSRLGMTHNGKRIKA